MAVKKDQVLLVSGQLRLTGNESGHLAAEVIQRVVIAEDDKAAYQMLAVTEPQFFPIGHATLQQYEDVAAKLRATLKGDQTGWTILVAPGMNI